MLLWDAGGLGLAFLTQATFRRERLQSFRNRPEPMIPGKPPFIKLMNERQELADSIDYLDDWNVGVRGQAVFE